MRNQAQLDNSFEQQNNQSDDSQSKSENSQRTIVQNGYSAADLKVRLKASKLYNGLRSAQIVFGVLALLSLILMLLETSKYKFMAMMPTLSVFIGIIIPLGIIRLSVKGNILKELLADQLLTVIHQLDQR